MNKRYVYVFLVGLFCILVLRYRDYYRFELNEGGYLEEFENSGEEEYRGVIASVGNFPLKPGEYSIQIHSASWGSGNCFEIVDTAYSNGTEIQDKVLYSAVYEKGVAENTYTFTLDDRAENLCIRSCQVDGSLSIEGYELRSIKPYYADTWFLAFLWVLIWAVFWHFRSWFQSKEARPFLLLCAVGLAVSLPLFTDFMAHGHDAMYHLQRVNGIIKSLNLGDQFPVRVNTAFNDGYGQVTPIMYPELFLYIPGILGALGVSLLISVKFLLVLINIAAGLISYYSIKTVTKERVALLFSLLYVMAPYRLNNLYIRFALGEYLAMTFLPLLFAGIYQIVCKDEKKWWMAAAGCCCVIQSHVLTTEMSVFFTAVFLLVNIRSFLNWNRIRSALKAVTVTVLLNLWYLVPLVQFMGFHFGLTETPGNLGANGVYFSQMFSFWYSTNQDQVTGSTYHDMTLTVGLTLLIGTAVYLLYRKAIAERNPGLEKLIKSCFVSGVLAVYMASWLFPWQLVYQVECFSYIFGIIQFSWRFLIFVTLFLSMVTAFAMDWCLDEKRTVAGVLLFCLVASAVILENGYTYENQSIMVSKFDQSYEDFAYSGYYKKDYGTWIPLGRGNVVSLEKEAGLEIENYQRDGADLSFDFALADENADASHVMTFPYYNYGFYHVELDGTELETFSNEQELVSVSLPAAVKGGHIELGYEERKLYKLCSAVSLGMLLLIAGVTAGKRYRFQRSGGENEKNL